MNSEASCELCKISFATEWRTVYQQRHCLHNKAWCQGSSLYDESCQKHTHYIHKMVPSTEEMKEHYWSLMHHVKIEQKKKNSEHTCKLCFTTCENLKQYGQHLNHVKHKQALMEYRKARDKKKQQISDRSKMEELERESQTCSRNQQHLPFYNVDLCDRRTLDSQQSSDRQEFHYNPSYQNFNWHSSDWNSVYHHPFDWQPRNNIENHSKSFIPLENPSWHSVGTDFFKPASWNWRQGANSYNQNHDWNSWEGQNSLCRRLHYSQNNENSAGTTSLFASSVHKQQLNGHSKIYHQHLRNGAQWHKTRSSNAIQTSGGNLNQKPFPQKIKGLRGQSNEASTAKLHKSIQKKKENGKAVSSSLSDAKNLNSKNSKCVENGERLQKRYGPVLKKCKLMKLTVSETQQKKTVPKPKIKDQNNKNKLKGNLAGDQSKHLPDSCNISLEEETEKNSSKNTNSDHLYDLQESENCNTKSPGNDSLLAEEKTIKNSESNDDKQSSDGVAKEALLQMTKSRLTRKQRLTMAHVLQSYAKSQNKLAPRLTVNLSGLYDSEIPIQELNLKELPREMKFQIEKLVEQKYYINDDMGHQVSSEDNNFEENLIPCVKERKIISSSKRLHAEEIGVSDVKENISSSKRLHAEETGVSDVKENISSSKRLHAEETGVSDVKENISSSKRLHAEETGVSDVKEKISFSKRLHAEETGVSDVKEKSSSSNRLHAEEIQVLSVKKEPINYNDVRIVEDGSQDSSNHPQASNTSQQSTLLRECLSGKNNSLEREDHDQPMISPLQSISVNRTKITDDSVSQIATDSAGDQPSNPQQLPESQERNIFSKVYAMTLEEESIRADVLVVEQKIVYLKKLIEDSTMALQGCIAEQDKLVKQESKLREDRLKILQAAVTCKESLQNQTSGDWSLPTATTQDCASIQVSGASEVDVSSVRVEPTPSNSRNLSSPLASNTDDGQHTPVEGMKDSDLTTNKSSVLSVSRVVAKEEPKSPSPQDSQECSLGDLGLTRNFSGSLPSHVHNDSSKQGTLANPDAGKGRSVGGMSMKYIGSLPNNKMKNDWLKQLTENKNLSMVLNKHFGSDKMKVVNVADSNGSQVNSCQSSENVHLHRSTKEKCTDTFDGDVEYQCDQIETNKQQTENVSSSKFVDPERLKFSQKNLQHLQQKFVTANVPQAEDTDPDYQKDGVLIFKGQEKPVTCLQVFENHLYVCYQGYGPRKFQLSTQQSVQKYDCASHAVQSMLVVKGNANTNHLFAGGAGKVLLDFDADTGILLSTYEQPEKIHCMHCRWGYLYVGLGHGCLATVNLKINKQEKEMFYGSRPISCIASGTEGGIRLLCIGAYDATLVICDARSGLFLRSLNSHTRVLYSIKVHNNFVYSGAADSKVMVHNLSTGKLIKSYHHHSATVSGLWVDDDWLITASHDKYIHFYDLKNDSEPFFSLYGPEMAAITSLTLHENSVFSGNFKGVVQSVPFHKNEKWECNFNNCSKVYGLCDHLLYHMIAEHNLTHSRSMELIALMI